MSLKDYDPTRATERTVFQYVAFPFDNDKIGERAVLIAPQELDGKGPDEIRTHIQQLHEVFRRAEKYAEAQDFSYTDEKALERATELYEGAIFIVIANCYGIYTARLREETKEARMEQAYLNELNEKIDINEHIAEAREKVAMLLCKQWLEESGPEHARELVRAADFHATKQLAAAAILEADEQVPSGALDEVWGEAFEQLYRAQIERGYHRIYEAYVYGEARDILENDVKPVELPFKELRIWAGLDFLELLVEHKESFGQLALPAKRKLVNYTDSLFTSGYEPTRTQSQLDLCEGRASAGHRITPAQVNLMIYILLSSYDNMEGERPFIWSPKAYLGRSPTKTEAATLSRRVSTLAHHSLIKKSGREVSVTDYGKALIRTYTAERNHEELLKVRLVLDLNEAWKNLEALRMAGDVARRHRKLDLVRRDGKGPLHDLLLAEMDRKDRLIQQLRDDNPTQHV